MKASSTSRSKRVAPAKRKQAALDDATRMAKALSHPLRARVLGYLNERSASPNEMAQAFDEPLGNVSYHVRALLELDCIELVETKPRRGAVEHFYRAIQRAWGDEAAWELLPPSARRGFAGYWFTEAFEDAQKAIEEGGFERRADCHLTFTRLNLDERAWKKLSKRMDALLDYAMDLQAESAGRKQKDESAPELKTGLILAQYEGAAKPKKQRRKKR